MWCKNMLPVDWEILLRELILVWLLSSPNRYLVRLGSLCPRRVFQIIIVATEFVVISGKDVLRV